MAMLLIPLIPLLSVVRCTLIKQSSKDNEKINIFAFNAVQNISGILIMLIVFGFGLQLHLPTFYFSLAYAVCYLVGMVSDYKALSSGPMALTSLICSYAIIIPCFYGFFFLDESFGITRIIGIALLLVSMFLINKTETEKAKKREWLFYVCISFLCNGGMLVINKMHQIHYPNQYQNEMIIFALGIGFIVFGLIAIINGILKKRNKAEYVAKTPIKASYAVFAGICMAALQYVCLYVAARVDSLIMFPLDAIYGSLFSVAGSWFLFKEKFTIVQILGICLGVVSVILLNS
ncbi:MAG: EamA family transporter [Clostridia bacterium]|nr:EamA family transporter [Clostridia bacterium]